MAQEVEQPVDDARPFLPDTRGELALPGLAEHVRVAIPGDGQMRVGAVVHAHKTGAGATIFPRVHKDYSQTPLPKKLGIGEGSRVALQGAPDGFAELLGVRPRTRGELDVVVLFATRQGELRRAFTPLARRLAPAGGLWIAWPKKSADVENDLSFELVQEIGLNAGLVDNKSCAIDETWQAVRFVYRRADRPTSSSKRSA